MSAPHTPDTDAMALGMALAQSNASAFVFCSHDMGEAERVDFIRAFLCCLAGMAEQSIGYETSREVLCFVSTLPPAGPVNPLQ